MKKNRADYFLFNFLYWRKGNEKLQGRGKGDRKSAAGIVITWQFYRNVNS